MTTLLVHPPIPELLADTMWWSLSGDIVTCWLADDVLRCVEVPLSAFAAVHPDFQEAIRYIAAHHPCLPCLQYDTTDTTKDNTAPAPASWPGSVLRCQLHYYQHPTCAISMGGAPFYVRRVEDLTWHPENDFIAFSGRGYYVANALPDDTGVPYAITPFVDHEATKSCGVRGCWMETQFPGWESRYHAAGALELTTEERIRFVCTAPIDTLHADVILPATLSAFLP